MAVDCLLKNWSNVFQVILLCLGKNGLRLLLGFPFKSLISSSRCPRNISCMRLKCPSFYFSTVFRKKMFFLFFELEALYVFFLLSYPSNIAKRLLASILPVILILTILRAPLKKEILKLTLKKQIKPQLRTFALIFSAHPYCAHNSRSDVMPRHALSARAVEKM